jgi:RNA polymerase sigma factor (sigma-70 family)
MTTVSSWPAIDAVDHLRLAAKVALRYKRIGELAGLEWDDLVQEARIGLLQAARNFDPGRRVQFSTLAYRMIRYRLLRVMKTPLRRIDKLKFEMLPSEDRLTDDQAVEAAEQEMDRTALVRLLALLNRADLQLIEARFGLDGAAPRNVSELAAMFKVSRQRIYQRLDHGLAELQRLARDYGMMD